MSPPLSCYQFDSSFPVHSFTLLHMQYPTPPCVPLSSAYFNKPAPENKDYAHALNFTFVTPAMIKPTEIMKLRLGD